MPGFVINGQGAGPFGGVPNNVETKRRHRWVWETIADSELDQNVVLLLQRSSRPHFTLEEPVLHHNQEQAYFAGKQSWETITFTWYDGEQDPNVSEAIWDWLNTVVNIPEVTVSPPAEYKKTGNLRMLDGAGESIEHWRMFGVWPKEVNWQDLDYTDTEIQTIEAIMRYDRAVLQQ